MITPFGDPGPRKSPNNVTSDLLHLAHDTFTRIATFIPWRELWRFRATCKVLRHVEPPNVNMNDIGMMEDTMAE
jgi:hypothetical protein